MVIVAFNECDFKCRGIPLQNVHVVWVSEMDVILLSRLSNIFKQLWTENITELPSANSIIIVRWSMCFTNDTGLVC